MKHTFSNDSHFNSLNNSTFISFGIIHNILSKSFIEIPDDQSSFSNSKLNFSVGISIIHFYTLAISILINKIDIIIL